jgi:hypothetical protein
MLGRLCRRLFVGVGFGHQRSSRRLQAAHSAFFVDDNMDDLFSISCDQI